MTTPQKQRRREILFIILVGVVMATFVSLSLWQSSQDRAAERRDEDRDTRQNVLFQRCITDVVGDLVSALNARSELSQRDINSITGLISDAIAANGDPVKGEKAVDKYNTEREKISKERKENPFPPFPDGTCDFTNDKQESKK